MTSLLISLLICALILGLFSYIIHVMPLPQPYKSVVHVTLLVIFIIWILNRFGGYL